MLMDVNGYIYIYLSIWLVVGYISGWWVPPTPLKNDGVKVSWDDDNPPIYGKIKFMFQTTNQFYNTGMLGAVVCQIDFFTNNCTVQAQSLETLREDGLGCGPVLLLNMFKPFFPREIVANPIIADIVNWEFLTTSRFHSNLVVISEIPIMFCFYCKSGNVWGTLIKGTDLCKVYVKPMSGNNPATYGLTW